MTTAVSEPSRLSPDIEKRLCSRAEDIGTLPAVALQAIDLSNDPDCEIRDFAALIERDPSLATGILSMANSVLYCTGNPVLNLKQAVLRLGFDQCRYLILSTSMGALMKNIRLEEEWVRETLCRHGYVAGLLATKISRSLNINTSGEEFAAGLIHDFGRTVLAVCFPEDFAEADPMSFDETADDAMAIERQVLGTDHAEVGLWFGERNKLPEALNEVIYLHHQPEAATIDPILTALINISDHMANYLQRTGNSVGYTLECNAAVAVLEAHGISNVHSRLADVAPALMENALAEADEMACF
ncbi:MAG: HDOD domain-containing protein [Planctomycetaceae bacterium]|nr:HDOD domain-containing protein [Planctomycetaceae bacterium]